MKLRNTLILIAVFGALAAYFLLVEKPAQETPAPTATPAAALNVYDYVTTDVIGITVSEGPTRTVLQRANEQVPWQLVEPVKETADEIRANEAATQFALLRASRVLTDPADIRIRSTDSASSRIWGVCAPPPHRNTPAPR